MPIDPTDRARLDDWIVRAQRIGLIGPGEPELHLRHSEGFLAVIGEVSPAPVALLDLGTGGGLPGLVLAMALPHTAVTLLDGKARSIEALRVAVLELGLDDRVTGVEARAEVAGHDPDLRERFPLVVARAFGRPGTTAECAAPFLSVGGHLVVSEPPEPEGDRWAVDRAPDLGLELLVQPAQSSTRSRRFVVLHKVRPTAAALPRRVDLPRRRPLF